MPALTIRVFLFLVFAIISCWTVIAGGQSPEGQDAPGKTAARTEGPKQVETPPVEQKTDPVDLEQAAAQIVDATNAFRQEQGLEALQRQEQLQQAARQFAEFMSREDLYGHHADGRTPAERAQAAGYTYCMVRENIAYRTDTRDNSADGLRETFFSGWKESPEHRQNMLAEHVTDTAVAIVTEDGTTFYAVQMFGRPRSDSIEVRVRNRSEQIVNLKIESDYGVDSFELPPQTIATFTRCLPSTLTLKDSANQVNVDQSASFEIVAADEQQDQLRLKRQENASAAASG